MPGELVLLWQQQPLLFISSVVVLGLVVGSFLNVVIYRLPIIMERGWQQQCQELLQLPRTTHPPLTLSRPRSRCPHCGQLIRAWENIPLFSYLWQRGRCTHCGEAISARYPLVEVLTALLSGITAWHFGVSWETLFALLLGWALIALSLIDFDHQLLPDNITLPLLWLGLALSLGEVFSTTEEAIIGAMAGYLSLWLVYWSFKLVTGKEGMGYGDFKLLAALGAWLGWQSLPLIILLSSLVGAVVGIGLIVLRGRDRQLPIPFGPYLAAAGWITLLWGDAILQAYLG